MNEINCLKCNYMHKDNGNCVAAGGICTSVRASDCQKLKELLQNEESGPLTIRPYTPPCNVGDTVYIVSRGQILPLKIYALVLLEYNFEIKATYKDDLQGYSRLTYCPENIGKTVFFSESDAKLRM